MTPSNDCLGIIESSEGLRLKAYQDTGGVWTIGYGHTGGVMPNHVITKDTAIILLNHDMNFAVDVVNSHALPCTQGQFDALVDFVFNVGPSQFLSSHLFAYHVSRDYEKAAAEFPKWKYDNGKVIEGLVIRRGLEKALYTRQEQLEDHPHTDEQEHSVSSVPYPAPAELSAGNSQPSPVQPVPISGTAPASSTGSSVFLSQAGVLIRKLIGRG